MLSVAIIAKNEEKTIGRVIESVKPISDDIVVIDSGSTDQTTEICREKGATVIYNEWKGYAPQKNFAIGKCKHKWILSIDADEVIPQELANEIQQKVNEDKSKAYLINRKTYYMGKLMNRMWQPDYQLRLFSKENEPFWEGDYVHETLRINADKKKLSNYLVHYSYEGLYDHFNKLVNYSRLAAKKLKSKGKKPSVLNLIINPLWKFFHHYFVKLGLLDGFRGFIASFSSLVYTFLKYAFLYEEDDE